MDKSGEIEGMDSFIEMYEKFQDFLSKLSSPSSVVSNGGSSSSDGDNSARNTFFGVSIIYLKEELQKSKHYFVFTKLISALQLSVDERVELCLFIKFKFSKILLPFS